jgi:hypothetical protein
MNNEGSSHRGILALVPEMGKVDFSLNVCAEHTSSQLNPQVMKPNSAIPKARKQAACSLSFPKYR